MSREIELNNFIDKANELIDSSYILADIKIINLLKAIASSETIVALFKNCLTDFDYEGAKNKYYVENQFLANDRKLFVLPESQKDIISFVFMVLMDIDGKKISLSDYLDRYFFVDGSSSSSYSLFIKNMILPFVSTVVKLVQDILGGKVEEPDDALKKIETKKKKEAEKLKKQQEEDIVLSSKRYGENLKKIKRILNERKDIFSKAKLSVAEKAERITVIDRLLDAIDKKDKEEITYAFLCYYHMSKSHIFRFSFKARELRKLLGAVIYEI